MKPDSVSSPVSLSYVATLRGIAPRVPGTSFTYAVANCRQPSFLTCLAASNPEGSFFGLVPDQRLCAQAQDEARAQQVQNVTFICATVADVAAKRAGSLPPLNYLCADESETALPAAERAALFDLATNSLLPGGLFHYSYRAYSDGHGALRFLVREFGPEMSAEQAKEFLLELKTLGAAYFADHPAASLRLEHAIATAMPDEFFDDYDAGDARSATFDTIVALRPRGFSYSGDARIPLNYMDLSVSPEAQKIILSCAANHLYEMIKDLALNNTVRSDIWCREAATRSNDLADLFGGFSYGIVAAEEDVPAEIRGQGKTVDLSSPLFAKLIKLMTLMPISIGDFLSHPDGKGVESIDVVGAIQILIACGIAQPMRGLYRSRNLDGITQPKFAGSFNRSLGQKEVTDADILFASPALGSAVSISAQEALVMQALDRVGLANSVSALLPELERLSKKPGRLTPTPESAHHLLEDTVSRSIVQWYAYGLLEAA